MKRIIILIFIIQAFAANAQWQQTACPIFTNDWFSCLASNGNYILAGTMYNGIFRSNNGGSSWEPANAGMIDPYVNAMICKGDTFFAGVLDNGGSVYLSTDNGTNWLASNPIINSVNAFAINGNNIYACAGQSTGGGSVYLTSNNGVSWSSLTAFTNGVVTATVILGNNLLAGSMGPGNIGIYLSSNNGLTWSLGGLNNLGIRTMTLCGNTIFAGSSNIYTSSDSGITWSVSSNGFTANGVRSFLAYGNIIFAGGNNQGVFFSTNFGANWENVTTGLPATTIYSLMISNGWIYAGTYNAGVWKRPLAEILSSVEEQNHLEISLYPNPAREKVIIESESISINSIVKVFNMNTQLLIEKPLQRKTTEVDISMLSSGIYIVKVQNEQTIKVWKFIKE